MASGGVPPGQKPHAAMTPLSTTTEAADPEEQFIKDVQEAGAKYRQNLEARLDERDAKLKTLAKERAEKNARRNQVDGEIWRLTAERKQLGKDVGKLDADISSLELEQRDPAELFRATKNRLLNYVDELDNSTTNLIQSRDTARLPGPSVGYTSGVRSAGPGTTLSHRVAELDSVALTGIEHEEQHPTSPSGERHTDPSISRQMPAKRKTMESPRERSRERMMSERFFGRSEV